MKFSIKNMKFSINEVCQNSSFVLFVTEFSYHMYRKNAVLNGKQKQMKPLLVFVINIAISENKAMQKAPSSGILHQLHQNYYKNFEICYQKHVIKEK